MLSELSIQGFVGIRFFKNKFLTFLFDQSLRVLQLTPRIGFTQKGISLIEKIGFLEPEFFFLYLKKNSGHRSWMFRFLSARNLGEFFGERPDEVEELLSRLAEEGPVLDGVGKSLTTILLSQFEKGLPLIEEWARSPRHEKRRSVVLAFYGWARSEKEMNRLAPLMDRLAADPEYKVCFDVGSRLVRKEMAVHMPDTALDFMEKWADSKETPRLRWQAARAISKGLYRRDPPRLDRLISRLRSDADGMVQKALQSGLGRLSQEDGKGRTDLEDES